MRFCGMRVSLAQSGCPLSEGSIGDWLLTRGMAWALRETCMCRCRWRPSAGTSTSRRPRVPPPCSTRPWSSPAMLMLSVVAPLLRGERALRRHRRGWCLGQDGTVESRSRCSSSARDATACRFYRDLGINGYRAESPFLHGRPYATGDSSLCMSCSSAGYRAGKWHFPGLG